MLAELGAIEALIITLAVGGHIWTLVVAARRGRWGWFAAIFFFSWAAILFFWLFNPSPVDRGPRVA